MKRYTCPPHSAAHQLLFTAIAIFLAAPLALAQSTTSITYTGFTITDGQLGAWQFHNARVILTIQSDTNSVQTLTQACVGTDAAFNSAGSARVTIIDHEKVVHARLAPNQLFVSFDQDYGGVGIGSFAPGPPFVPATCANAASLQPAYPLGLHHGTMDAAGVQDSTYSSNQQNFPDNLQGDVGFSGKGYVCDGIPQELCVASTVPLLTDDGYLFLAEPYQGYRNADLVSLNGAFFFQQTSPSGFPLPRSVLAPSSSVANGPITHHMFLVSDVSLNGQLFQNASIHLSFQSNTSRVAPLALGGPHGYINTHGVARVDIKSGTSTVSAQFARGQVYVYFDPLTASAGFGSVSGGRAYPAALFPTAVHSDTELLAAVADILNGGTTYYTQPTIDLANATDLKHETMLAEYVSSCGNFDFSIGVCNDLINYPRLITDQGDFYLHQPYNRNSNLDPTSAIRSSDNWAVFWTTYPIQQSDD
jgi:hypothetical protein